MSDSFHSNYGVSYEINESMIELRRNLHQHPELSHQEEKTAQRIANHLDRLNLPYKTGVGGFGVVAEIPGKEDGPFIALRSDMDALPIQEETGLPFSSIHSGVMHACGHDGHSSMLMGAAHLLSGKEQPTFPIRFIWQPAEEKGTGAQAMIKDGVLKDVAMIFGGHLDRRYPAGELIISEGAVNASTDTFRIEIHGQEGHGARPHEAVDAVVVGSLLVTAVQTIVSREVDPAHPSVLSIGKFVAGSAPNVIAGTALLEGTIRAQDLEVRESLNLAIRRIAKSIGELHGAEIKTEFHSGSPPVINSPEMTQLAIEAGERVVGKDCVKPLHTANMGGEDFAFYLEHVRGCYIRFGGKIPGREGHPAHSSRFDFDERALAAGAAWFSEVAHLAAQHLKSKPS